MFRSLTLISAFLLSTLACGGSATESDNAAAGTARFADAETNPDGSTREAAPVSDTFNVSVEVAGSGELDGLDATCLDGPAGFFEGVLEGSAEIDEGVYLAAVATASGGFETPAGCAIDSLEISALTRVTVRAELVATASNCETYCSAKGRQSAEAECAGDSDQASCRAAAEGELEASCVTACDRSEHHIVAEAELSAAARAELLASQLSGSALGTIEADLVFDRVEDDGGVIVDER